MTTSSTEEPARISDQLPLKGANAPALIPVKCVGRAPPLAFRSAPKVSDP
jgi:hypothetical protein